MATSHTVRAGDIRLAYTVSGESDAPPMVLLHALVSAAPTGRRWLAKLAAAAAILPDSTLVTIPAGHLVHAARPGEFVAAVLSWLDG
jgi:pimeloyl-ACP methyl ester carboxylesterase